MRPATGGARIAFPHPGRAVIALLAANIVCYVLQLALLRLNTRTFVEDLYLSPAEVFQSGRVWQVFTYMWLHDPRAVSHLLFNMLFLWMFGSQLEKWWGGRRFAIAYVIFGLGGAALTLTVALLSRTDVFGPLLGDFWSKPHLGASGAVLGITFAWGLTFANQTINLLFLGEMKGRTFLWIIVAIQLLVALSFDPTSSTSHFGGMIAAVILCKGLWRPSKWGELFRRGKLERRRKQIESELRVLDGGKSGPPKNPRDWN